MEKKITYKDKEYTIEVKWTGFHYGIKCNEATKPWVYIPKDCLNDIERIKPYIKAAIEGEYNLEEIDKWDGKL